MDSPFIKKLKTIEDERNKEKDIEKLIEARARNYLQVETLIMNIMHYCEQNAEKHIIEGIYGYEEDPAWANGIVNYTFVPMKRNEIKYSYINYAYDTIEGNEFRKKVISILKEEIQKLGFVKYEVEMIKKEEVKQVGKTFWTREPILEKTGKVGYILYIKIEW